MMSRRLPSDGDSSQCDALPGSCLHIGQQLVDARVRRKLSVDEVAGRLLLSRAQVLGLEHANLDPFYGRAFFFKALRRYIALAGLDDELATEADPTDEFGGLRMTLAFAEASAARPTPAWIGGLKTVPALVAVVGVLSGAAAVRWISVGAPIPARVEQTEPLPSRPTATVQPPQPTVHALSAVDADDPARQ